MNLEIDESESDAQRLTLREKRAPLLTLVLTGAPTFGFGIWLALQDLPARNLDERIANWLFIAFILSTGAILLGNAATVRRWHRKTVVTFDNVLGIVRLTEQRHGQPHTADISYADIEGFRLTEHVVGSGRNQHVVHLVELIKKDGAVWGLARESTGERASALRVRIDKVFALQGAPGRSSAPLPSTSFTYVTKDGAVSVSWHERFSPILYPVLLMLLWLPQLWIGRSDVQWARLALRIPEAVLLYFILSMAVDHLRRAKRADNDDDAHDEHDTDSSDRQAKATRSTGMTAG